MVFLALTRLTTTALVSWLLSGSFRSIMRTGRCNWQIPRGKLPTDGSMNNRLHRITHQNWVGWLVCVLVGVCFIVSSSQSDTLNLVTWLDFKMDFSVIQALALGLGHPPIITHPCRTYRKTSNIRRTLVGNKIVDNSDVVGASPVGAAPTTSSLST